MSWKNVKSFCKDNSNTIFTVLACAFTVGTAVATVVETAKACKDISDAEYDKWEALGEPEEPNVDITLTAGETVKLVWPRYIVPGLLLTGAVTFEILALKAGQKKIEAVTGAYVMAAQTLSAVRESIRENMPEKDIRRIEQSTQHKLISADRANPKTAAIMDKRRQESSTGTIYRDAYSVSGCGIYYKCTPGKQPMEEFRRAVHLFNSLVEDYGQATLNDWYDCLSRCGIDVGRSDCGDVQIFYHIPRCPFDLYSVPDSMDSDFDDNATVSIGLRRRDCCDLAMYESPRALYSKGV